MKKTKKTISSIAIASMLLTMIPFNVLAAGLVPTRISGNTAEQTAVQIAEQTSWTGTAILASSTSYGMVDALTVGPLATFLKAPILLTEAGNVLNADTKAELIKLKATTVFVTSGTGVISQAVLDQLRGMGIAVVSLGGADRFETAANIAKKMVEYGAKVSKVAVAYGWKNQDALSIASIASAQTQPILLTEKDSIPASVKDFLAANPIVKSTDVIGGTGVISDSVKAQFPNTARYFGNTAYDTNLAVLKAFDSVLKYDNVFIANGETAIDALAGAPLAAKFKAGIVLTNGVANPGTVYVGTKLSSNSIVTALGGTAVVPDVVRKGIADLTPAAVGGGGGGGGGFAPAPVPVTPSAPSVIADDILNTVSGMAVGMEYKLDGAGYVAYNPTTFATLNLTGAHTLLVRVAAAGINPFGPDTTLLFTIDPVTPLAPSVNANDKLNTVTGMAAGMEYKLDNAAVYTLYDATTFNLIDLGGNHTLLVRFAQAGINPPSAATSLIFTANLGAVITGLPSVMQFGAITTATAITVELSPVWTSSAPLVATVNSVTGVVNALSPGITTIAYTSAANNGHDNAQTITVYAAIVTAPPTIGPVQVGAGPVTPTGFTAPSALQTITWASSNSTKATINPTTAVITPVTSGNVTISYSVTETATGVTIVTGSRAIIVQAAAVTGLDVPANVLQLGRTITATVATIEPGAANWTSSEPTIATVTTTSALGVVTVTALSPGVTTISYTTSTSGLVNSQIITVYAAATVVNPIIGVVQVGAGSVTPVIPTPGGGVTISWTSSDPTKATIDGLSGLITPVDAGFTTISYSVVTGTGYIVYGGTTIINVQAAAVVIPGAVTGVTLNKTSTILLIGQNETLAATVLPANATNKAVTWTSDKATVATVDSTGKVVAVNVGIPANITVKTVDGNFSTTCSVTVVTEADAVNNLVQSISLMDPVMFTTYTSLLRLNLAAYDALTLAGQAAVQSDILFQSFGSTPATTAAQLQTVINASVLANAGL